MKNESNEPNMTPAPEVGAVNASDATPGTTLNLEQINTMLKGKTGPAYWRGLEEIAESPEFNQWIDDEFPNRKDLLTLDRRTLLKFMGASLAMAGLSGCRSVFLPAYKLVPYVKQPEDLTIGKPLYYASGISSMGYGLGILVQQREGRAIKIEGNPSHPISLGALDSQTQAQTLNLYDPDRLQTVMNDGAVGTWDQFLQLAQDALNAQKSKQGAGFRILTDTVTSPSLANQIKTLLKKYPQAEWHVYEAVDGDNSRLATFQGLGKQMDPQYNLKDAKVILALDSDFLLRRPESLRLVREFADGRRVVGKSGEMNRLYSIESSLTITGATADHRYPVKPSEVYAVAAAIASALGVAVTAPATLPVDSKVINAIVQDLKANAGSAVVIPGEMQSPEVHTLALAINDKIGALNKTVSFTAPVDYQPAPRVESLASLTQDLTQGKVDTIFILNGNPVYDAPTDLKFGDALKKAKFKAHFTLIANETSNECDWSVPLTHALEQWNDLRATDGTITIGQPIMYPLYADTRSAVEIFAELNGNANDGYDLIRSQYKALSEDAFKTFLNKGIIDGSAAKPVSVTFNPACLASLKAPSSSGGVEIKFTSCGKVGDGRWANNGWLRELPDPITRITWDNVIQVSPKDAVAQSISYGNMLEVSHGGVTITGPAFIQPGQPDGSVTVILGYGRQGGGVVATADEASGYNAYPIRTSTAMNFVPGSGQAEVKNTGGSYRFANVQLHHSMQSRDIIRQGSLADFNKAIAAGKVPFLFDDQIPDQGKENQEQSFYPEETFQWDGERWGMTIDLNLCVGCGACVTACQSENNISVVGKDQVCRAREMQWIRIDRYYGSNDWYDANGKKDTIGNTDTEEAASEPNVAPVLANPAVTFQPVMCVQCEKAPCEPVCPVAATVHSHDGLNQMVYNRCVGTRYCSDNCPYKVRRFNFLNYQFNQPNFSGEDRIPNLRLMNNPNVTVRSRGVMEKCTYCVQRISGARIESKKAGIPIADGTIITACQQSCPAQAITFGDINDKSSRVKALREDPRSYLLLEDLNTRPRTSHLSRLRNPNPEIVA